MAGGKKNHLLDLGSERVFKKRLIFANKANANIR